MSEEAIGPPRHEVGDVGAGFAIRAVALLAGSLIACGLVLAWVFPDTLTSRFVPSKLPEPPAPALQSSPRTDMSEFYQAEMRRLNGTGWLDRNDGRVHIPIGDAMRKVAAEGIAGWPGAGR